MIIPDMELGEHIHGLNCFCEISLFDDKLQIAVCATVKDQIKFPKQ